MASNQIPSQNDTSTRTQAEQKIGRQGEAADREAREAGRQAAATAKEMGREASDRVRAASEETRSRIRETAEQWKGQGRSMLTQQKDWAAEELDHIGGAVRQAAGKLHEENDDRMASYAESMAGCVDDVACYVRDRDVDAIANDAGHMVRERPAWVLGGLFVAGLAAARFLKASSPPRRHEHSAGRPVPGRGVAPPPGPEPYASAPPPAPAAPTTPSLAPGAPRGDANPRTT